MHKYIDADKLLAEAKQISGPITGDGWDNWGVYTLIERQPAVDVRENVRGKWLPKGRWYCCSECGHDMIFTGTYDEEQRYCSYCGADMGEGQRVCL